MSTSTDVAVPEPGIPPALAGAKTQAAMYQHLRTETRLAFVPACTAVASGGVDLWLHELMIQALHTNPLAAPLLMAVGAVWNGSSTLIAAWVLARKGAADGLVVKHVGWGSVVSGALLTLLGTAWPVADLAYPVVATIGMWPWHKNRRQVRKALRKALISAEQGEAAPQVEATPETVPAIEVPEPAAPSPAVVMGELVDLVGRWKRGVAVSTVTGSSLINPRVVDGRPVFTVDGGDKGIVLAEVNGKRELIAAALRLKLPDSDGKGGQDVVFDQPGGIGLDRGQLRLQIVDTDSVAARAQRVTDDMTEVSPAGNPYAVRLGSYIDDGSPVYHTLADEQGVWSGVIVAGTGMGKSSLVDALMYRARRRGFHTLFLDPQRGASSPIQARYSTWPCLGVDMAVPALRFLEEAADYRNNWLALHPAVSQILPGMTAPCVAGGEDPDPDCPCGGVVPPPILAIVEECDQVFKALLPKSSVKLGEPYGVLAKIFRKLGMGIIAVTQLPDIGTFGGSDMLRSNLPIRNLLAMHVSSNTGGTLIPGLPYNPKLIPAVTGRALPCGPSARVMECVLDWLPRREKARSGVPGPYAEDLYDALPPLAVHPADQAAAGHWFPQATDTLSLAREQARSAVAAILAGQRPAPDTGHRVSAPMGDAGLSWAEPVTARVAPPTAAELHAMVNGVTTLADEVLTAVADLADEQWLTVGALAARMGRVAEDAGTQERARVAGVLGGELAAARITTTRRADGKSVRVADLRNALVGD